MAITKTKKITAVDIKEDGAALVYYELTFKEDGEDDEVHSKTKTFAKSDVKPTAVKNFVKNYLP